MESRAYALATGLFVLLLAAAAVAWAHWLQQEPARRLSVRVVSTLPVTGLNPQAQVRYRGVAVGRVAAVRLDTGQGARRVLVDLEVDENVPITKGTYARLGMQGITGIAYVELEDDGRDVRAAEPGTDGVPEVPLRPSFFDSLADGAGETLRELRELAARLGALAVPENRERFGATLEAIARTAANVERASLRLPRLAEGAERWMSDESRRHAHEALAALAETARALPPLVREATGAVGEARAFLRAANEAAAAAGGIAATVRDDIAPRAEAALEALEGGARGVGRLAYELERSPSSVVWGNAVGRPGPGEPGFQ